MNDKLFLIFFAKSERVLLKRPRKTAAPGWYFFLQRVFLAILFGEAGNSAVTTLLTQNGGSWGVREPWRPRFGAASRRACR
jgi:hypothetical protein